MTFYDNGAINGTVLGWTINFGVAVSDQFTLGGNSTVNGITFGGGLYPGDFSRPLKCRSLPANLAAPASSIRLVNFTAGTCNSNGSFNVCAETGSFSGVALNAGSYWLNLSNAVSAAGNPVYWDMNSGPSLASGKRARNDSF